MARSSRNASRLSSLRGREAAERPSADPGAASSVPGAFHEFTERIAMLEAANHVLRREAEIVEFSVAEVEHRLLNSFNVIEALVKATARPNDTGDDFRAGFVPRLMALAGSHALLSASHCTDSTLDEVVRRCLSPHGDDPARVAVSGPPIRLPARNVPTLGLAFHELATNATKYGALSVPTGRIDVDWTLRAQDALADSMVEILWRERDGPPVRIPQRRGFGSLLLERGLDTRHGGAVRLDFAPDGLRCHIRMPLTSA